MTGDERCGAKCDETDLEIRIFTLSPVCDFDPERAEEIRIRYDDNLVGGTSDDRKFVFEGMSMMADIHLEWLFEDVDLTIKILDRTVTISTENSNGTML